MPSWPPLRLPCCSAPPCRGATPAPWSCGAFIARGLNDYIPAVIGGLVDIGACPFADVFVTAQPPPNTLCHTVYTDRTTGLTVIAWPDPKINRCWLVHFHRWSHKAARNLLHQTAIWRPVLGWDCFGWHPVGARLIPPAALAAVEAWLAEQATEVVK